MRPPGVLDVAPGIALTYLPVALVVLAVLGAGLFAIRARRVSRTTAARATGLDLAIATWLALTLLVTVVPLGRTGRPPIGFIPFLDALDRIELGYSTPSSEAADIILNVLLFMPLGAWAALRLGRRWLAATIVSAAAFSFAIELTQALEAVGRFPSATDVVTNTAGAALGFLAGARIRGPATTTEDA
jgi:glycopeptide antibiotics resistance protein